MSAIENYGIETTFVALDAARGARALPVTPNFWSALEADELGEFTRLVSSFSFDADWQTWEMHPAGEELVLLLSGHARVLLQRDGEAVQQTVLEHAGDFVLIPAGAWHTARTNVPTSMLFITPGEGTTHRPVEAGSG